MCLTKYEVATPSGSLASRDTGLDVSSMLTEGSLFISHLNVLDTQQDYDMAAAALKTLLWSICKPQYLRQCQQETQDVSVAGTEQSDECKDL